MNKFGRMIRGISLCLMLCSFYEVVESFDFLVDERERSPSWYRENSTLYVARNTASSIDFAYATCNNRNSSSTIDCRVRIAGMIPPDHSCSVTLAAKSGDAKMLSLHHFRYHIVVFKWTEVSGDLVRNARYTITDLNTCTNHRELSIPVDLSENDSSFLNDIVLHELLNYDIFVSSKSACKGVNRCILYYRWDAIDGSQPLPLTVTLVNMTTKSDDDENFFIQGYDPSTKSHRLVYLNRTGGTKDLLKINQSSQWIQWNVYGLNVVCYSIASSKVVHWMSYYSGGFLHKSGNIKFTKPVELVGIDLLKIDIFVLVSKKAECKGDECWRLQVTKFNENKIDDQYNIKVDCENERKEIALDFTGIGKNLDIVYGCERGDENDERKSYFTVKGFSLTALRKLVHL